MSMPPSAVHLVEAIAAKDAALGERARAELLRETKASPTLVKYAEPSAVRAFLASKSWRRPKRS